MVRPFVSIVMSVYNGERYLHESINSILNQTFDNFEFIIIDDHSKDQSAQLIQSYTDQRIKYFKNDVNLGIAKSLNRGFDEAKGDFIARMDQDDISVPHRLERLISYFNEYPDTGVLASFVHYIDENGKDHAPTAQGLGERKVVSDVQIRRTLPNWNCIIHPSVMMKKWVCEKYKYSDALRPEDPEDYEYWLRIACDGVIFRKVPEPLLNYRKHSDSFSSHYQNKFGFLKPNIDVKSRFLIKRFYSPNIFVLHLLYHFFKDVTLYTLTLIFRFKILTKKFRP